MAHLSTLNMIEIKFLHTMLKQKRAIIIFLSAAVLFMLPMLGMLISNHVNWSVFDFVVAGIILFGTATLLEIILRNVTLKETRIVLIFLLAIIFLLVWLELAVGIFGTPLAGS